MFILKYNHKLVGFLTYHTSEFILKLVSFPYVLIVTQILIEENNNVTILLDNPATAQIQVLKLIFSSLIMNLLNYYIWLLVKVMKLQWNVLYCISQQVAIDECQKWVLTRVL